MWRTWRERPLRRSFRSLVSGRWFFAQGRGKQDQPTLGRTPRSSSRSRTASHSSPSPRSRPSSRPARERDSRGTLSSERTSQPANSMRAPALRLRAGLRRAWGTRAGRPSFARRGPARKLVGPPQDRGTRSSPLWREDAWPSQYETILSQTVRVVLAARSFLCDNGRAFQPKGSK